MPEYIWEYVCLNDLKDGTYEFPEGNVIIRNGYIDWKPNEQKEE